MYSLGQNGKTKWHRLRVTRLQRIRSRPLGGWAGLARVGRGVASQGKHIRDRTEKEVTHKVPPEYGLSRYGRWSGRLEPSR